MIILTRHLEAPVSAKRKSQWTGLITALVLNTSLWALCLTYIWFYHGGWPGFLAMLTIIPVILITDAAIVILHFIFIVALLGRRASTVFRAIIYVIPSVFLLALYFASPAMPRPLNKTSPVTSPTGNYVALVDTVRNYWHVTIKTADDAVVYKHTQSDLHGFHSAYWAWDRADRLWLIHSDTSRVFFCENTPIGWQRHTWGLRKTGYCDRDIVPPLALYIGRRTPGPIHNTGTSWRLYALSQTSAEFSDWLTEERASLSPGESYRNLELIEIDIEKREVRVMVNSKELLLREL